MSREVQLDQINPQELSRNQPQDRGISSSCVTAVVDQIKSMCENVQGSLRDTAQSTSNPLDVMIALLELDNADAEQSNQIDIEGGITEYTLGISANEFMIEVIKELAKAAGLPNPSDVSQDIAYLQQVQNKLNQLIKDYNEQMAQAKSAAEQYQKDQSAYNKATTPAEKKQYQDAMDQDQKNENTAKQAASSDITAIQAIAKSLGSFQSGDSQVQNIIAAIAKALNTGNYTGLTSLFASAIKLLNGVSDQLQNLLAEIGHLQFTKNFISDVAELLKGSTLLDSDTIKKAITILRQYVVLLSNRENTSFDNAHKANRENETRNLVDAENSFNKKHGLPLVEIRS